MRAFLLSALLLMPAAVLAQDRQRVPPEADRSNSGSSAPTTAAPREAAPAPAPPPPAAPPPAASAPNSTTSQPATAAPRNSGTRNAATAGDNSSGQQDRRQRVPPEARANQPGDQAVPRGTVRPPVVNGDRRDGAVYRPYPHVYNNYYYYYPQRYYPYGYGAFGLGYFYYDPYTWGAVYGYPAYAPFRGYGYGYPTGELKLEVSPRDAEVYVDGYYAGRVDDFDGVFQSLELEEGTYRIEIVAPGFATLTFDVRILPGRKITYRGDLLHIRP